MMYIHSSNETGKRINVPKIANISSVGDNSGHILSTCGGQSTVNRVINSPE